MVKYEGVTAFLTGNPLLFLCSELPSSPSFMLFVCCGDFIDQVKIYSYDPAFFIFRVISHIASALCDYTGSRNILGRTWLTVQI